MNHGWTEHKSPDGRTYFYHKERGVSAWEIGAWPEPGRLSNRPPYVTLAILGLSFPHRDGFTYGVWTLS